MSELFETGGNERSRDLLKNSRINRKDMTRSTTCGPDLGEFKEMGIEHRGQRGHMTQRRHSSDGEPGGRSNVVGVCPATRH